MAAVEHQPLPFALPWQRAQWLQVAEAADSGRLHHALLLRGPAGTGKRQFATALAALLLCERPSAAPGSCGVCRGCKLRAASTHPDMHMLAPLDDKRSISVDQVRTLIDALSLTSHSGAWKVVLVTPTEALTRVAANTLLKTLEEPTGRCAFLLVAERSGLLLPTLRSRCQAMTFAKPSHVEGLGWLEERVSQTEIAASPERLAAALEAAGGAPLEAFRLLSESGLEALDVVVNGFVDLIAKRLGPVEMAQSWQPLGSGVVLHWLEFAIRDLMRAMLAGQWPSRYGVWAGLPMQQLVQRLDLQRLVELHGACTQMRRVVSTGVSLNEQLALESLALQCRDMGQNLRGSTTAD